MNQQIFLLFSKYSKACEHWMKKFKSCPIELKVNPICVDNASIRKKMFESTTLHISKLPCIIIVSGTVPTIYEGLLSFQWLENITQQFLNMSKLSNEQVKKSAIPPNAKVGMSGATNLEDIPFDEEYSEEEEEEEEEDVPDIANNPSGMAMKKPSITEQKKMSIADQIAQMQKERDMVEEQIKKSKAVPSNNFSKVAVDDSNIQPPQPGIKKKKKKIVMKSTN